MWITNGSQNKKVKTTDAIAEEWYKGRVNVHSEENKQKFRSAQHYNNSEKRRETMLAKYGTLNMFEINSGTMTTLCTTLRDKFDTKIRNENISSFDDLKTSAKRRRILSEQDNKCLHCKNDTWLDQPIILEIDHINGDNKDNRRCNLRLLCPNCHSQTPTWRRKKSSLTCVLS